MQYKLEGDWDIANYR